MQKHILSLAISALVVIMMAACSGNVTTVVVETPILELTAEGPLFEGANSSTATWEFDVNDLLGEVQGKVAHAKVASVEITLVDGEELPALEKMVFELTSQNTSMTRVGLHEGGFEVAVPVSLSIADKQENLAKAFNDGRITFVGDFDLLDEEFWGNVQFLVKVTFELGIK
jgi:hypothetical protein